LVTRPARPASVADARPVSGSTTSGVRRAYRAISFAFAIVIVLPMYSGVRPTNNPPMKTPASATITMLYRPVPKVRARLEIEHAIRGGRQKRLVQTFHAYERQHRLVARLERRIAKLERT